jgi:hypothetical protein
MEVAEIPRALGAGIYAWLQTRIALALGLEPIIYLFHRLTDLMMPFQVSENLRGAHFTVSVPG